MDVLKVSWTCVDVPSCPVSLLSHPQADCQGMGSWPCISLQAQSHGEHLPRLGGDAVLPFSPGLVVTESLGMVPPFLGILSKSPVPISPDLSPC